MKKIFFTTLVLFFIGCGGSSSGGIDYNTDNSSLSTGTNSDGYYGSSVMFGNHTAAREWTISYQGDTENLDLLNGGLGHYKDWENDEFLVTWGVSKDGKTLVFKGDISLTITSEVNANCYNTKVGGIDATVKICAD